MLDQKDWPLYCGTRILKSGLLAVKTAVAKAKHCKTSVLDPQEKHIWGRCDRWDAKAGGFDRSVAL